MLMLKLWYIDDMQVSSKMNINLCKPACFFLGEFIFRRIQNERFLPGNEEIGCLFVLKMRDTKNPYSKDILGGPHVLFN